MKKEEVVIGPNTFITANHKTNHNHFYQRKGEKQ